MSDVAGETIVVDETGKGDFQVEVKAGTSSFLMDEPVQAGGLGSGPRSRQAQRSCAVPGSAPRTHQA